MTESVECGASHNTPAGGKNDAGIAVRWLSWRGLLASAGTGVAGALAYQGDWLAAGGAALCVLVPVVLRFRRDLATTRAALRSLGEMVAQAAEQAAAARR